ncbi:hypothetical protein RFI_24031, partial [Reticulomyxa filosa]
TLPKTITKVKKSHFTHNVRKSNYYKRNYLLKISFFFFEFFKTLKSLEKKEPFEYAKLAFFTPVNRRELILILKLIGIKEKGFAKKLKHTFPHEKNELKLIAGQFNANNNQINKINKLLHFVRYFDKIMSPNAKKKFKIQNQSLYFIEESINKNHHKNNPIESQSFEKIVLHRLEVHERKYVCILITGKVWLNGLHLIETLKKSLSIEGIDNKKEFSKA